MKPRLLFIVSPDDKEILELENELNSYFQVLKLPDGKRALKLIKAQTIHIVVCARCLAHEDGLSVIRAIKKMNPGLPIICIASEPSDDFIISAFRAGVADFFKRPFKEKEIVVSIFSILAVRQNNRSTQKTHTPANTAETPSTKPSFFNKIKSALSQIFSEPLNYKVTPSDNDASKRVPGTISSEPPSLRVNFFGDLHLISNEDTVTTWPGKKGKSIFAYLAFHHKRKISRDCLMDIFWPDSTMDSARNCLNVTLHGLRQMFHLLDANNEYILFKNECYFINPEIEISLDVEKFKYYWRLAQSSEREKGIEAALGEYELAAALYKGDFMEDDLYEGWTALDRENLKEIYLVILDRLSNYYSCDGKPVTAINLCEIILRKDSCREDVHRRLMRCYYRLGQRDKAIKQFRKCSEILNLELEVPPTKTTISLFQQIKKDTVE